VQHAQATKEVISSCGAYQSPQLLLRSGIGPKVHSTASAVLCFMTYLLASKKHYRLTR
jgi:choline dehydrogenase-like flavoprotein